MDFVLGGGAIQGEFWLVGWKSLLKAWIGVVLRDGSVNLVTLCT